MTFCLYRVVITKMIITFGELKMSNNYAIKDIKNVIEQHKNSEHSEFSLRLVIKGEDCSTKHWNITEKQAKQIIGILQE